MATARIPSPATAERTRQSSIPSPRMPHFLQPNRGESLTSWLAASAESSGVDVKHLARQFHLHKLGSLCMGQTRLPEDVVSRMHRLSGIAQVDLHAMTLARYSGTALPHLPLRPWADAAVMSQWSSSAWLSEGHARWCAYCLQENGPRWPLQWMLPWAFACTRHNVYLTTECQRCLSVVYLDNDGLAPRRCAAVEDERFHEYGQKRTCDFPLARSHPLPVSDEAVISLQRQIEAWLHETPTAEDRRLVSLTAVLVLLMSPVMLRRGDPALLFALRTYRAPRPRQERYLWADPLRMAAAACVASRLLRATPSDAALDIEGMRTIDCRDTPFRLDVMDWAYGSALRPNAYIDELVRRGVITVGSFRYR